MTDIYIDESGDLGWTFSKPYNQGGSSRYLTLAFLIVEDIDRETPKRFIRKIRKKINLSPDREFKGYNLSLSQTVFFAQKVNASLDTHKSLRLSAITVMKENVEDHIRADPNKLYNYMVNLALMDELRSKTDVTLHPDNRSVKLASGHSLVDYLQTRLWFEFNLKTKLHWHPMESSSSLSIQFVDVISHIVWAHFERHHSDPFLVLQKHIRSSRLFFH
jgi:hypothetical protein